MSFPLNVYGLAFASAFLATAASLPLWWRWCRRTGLLDAPGHRKIHEQPIPLAGGWAVLTGIVAPLIGASGFLFVFIHWGDPVSFGGLRLDLAVDLLAYGFSRRAPMLIALLTGGLGMVILGWLDDRHAFSPAKKFIGQFLVAALVAAAGVRITLFVENPLFSYALTILWILTVTNACNFMDNMNGLCAGLGFVGAWCFAWSGAIQGQFLVASIGFLTSGALLGFLPFNYPKGRVFLGDAGSHLVGYLLAIMAILPHFYSSQTPSTLGVLKPLLILGVILGDLVWVVVLRWRLGKPFYVGDNNHLSHRLVRRGWSQATAVLLIWGLAALLGGLAFLL